MSILITFILKTYSELEICYKLDNYVNKPQMTISSVIGTI